MSDEPLRVLVNQGFDRRKFLSASAMTAMGGILAACGGSGGETDAGTGGGTSSSASVAPTVGTGKPEGNLHIYTWGEYNAPDTLKAFTSSVGPKIQLDSYASNEEMIAKLVAAKGTGGYDLVVPTGIVIPQMVQNGLLEPLNLEAIPNFKNLEKAFVDQEWDKGNKYSVCKDWGTSGYVYDKSKINRELTTWADFLDAAQNEASGQTSLLEDPAEITSVYFWANDIDCNTEDEADLAKCEDFIVKKLAKHIKKFESYPGTNGMPQGQFWLVHAWNGDARQGIISTKKDPERWQWVFPGPKTEIWMDTYAIPKGVKNINAAYAFINYLLDPKNSLTELEYLGYHTGVNDIQASAEAAKLPLLDLVFFTEEQKATMVPFEVNSAQQRHIDILNKAKAAAGA